jgi:hypothetical protein
MIFLSLTSQVMAGSLPCPAIAVRCTALLPWLALALRDILPLSQWARSALCAARLAEVFYIAAALTNAFPES